MTEEEIQTAVFQRMQAWLEANFYEKSRVLSSFGSPSWREQYESFMRDSGVRWDETLNALGIRRVEHHLQRPPRKGHIRINDPFMVGPNRRRHLEMTPEQANKILFLGIP